MASASSSTSASDAAFERFKVDNEIELLDLPYKFNQEADAKVRQLKPWRDNPNYFDVCFKYL